MLLVPWVIPPAVSCLCWLWLFDLLQRLQLGARPFCIGDPLDQRRQLGALLGYPGQYLDLARRSLCHVSGGAKSVPEQLYGRPPSTSAAGGSASGTNAADGSNIIAITALFSLMSPSPTSISLQIGRRRTDRPHARVRHLGIPARHQGNDIPLGIGVAVRGADPGPSPQSSFCAISPRGRS
jgi:hypothetical protein